MAEGKAGKRRPAWPDSSFWYISQLKFFQKQEQQKSLAATWLPGAKCEWDFILQARLELVFSEVGSPPRKHKRKKYVELLARQN